MRTKRFRVVAVVASLIVVPASVLADPPGDKAPTRANAAAQAAQPSSKGPDVADLLFSRPQWGIAPPGTKITYDYTKTTSDASLGDSFKDTVVITLDKGEEADSRTAEMQLFSGVRRRPAGPFRSDSQNPVLLVVLEENVQELSKLFKANPRYLKNAIRKAWRDDAKIEKTDVMVDGKSVPGTRIAVTPFVGDPEADRMKGLGDIAYVVEIADAVPGTIATVDIRAPATGKPLFQETLRYASEKTP